MYTFFCFLNLINNIAPIPKESKSQFVDMSMHKFPFTDEMLQIRIIEGMKEKRETHEE